MMAKYYAESLPRSQSQGFDPLDEIQPSRNRGHSPTASQADKRSVQGQHNYTAYHIDYTQGNSTPKVHVIRQPLRAPKRTPYRYERQNRELQPVGATTTNSSVSSGVISSSIPLYSPHDRNGTYASSCGPRSRSYIPQSRPPTPPLTPSSTSSSIPVPQYERPVQARYEPEWQSVRSPSPIRHHERESFQTASTKQYRPSKAERLRSRAKVKGNGAWKLGVLATIALTTYVIIEKRRRRKRRASQHQRGYDDGGDQEDADLGIWAHATQTAHIIEDPLPRTRSPRPYSAPIPDDDVESLGMALSSASVVSLEDAPAQPELEEHVSRPGPRLFKPYNPADYVPTIHREPVRSRQRSPSMNEESEAGPSHARQSPRVAPSSGVAAASAALVRYQPINAKAAASNTTPVSCIVCDSDIWPSTRRAPTSRCNATCNVCTSCMSQWLDTQITSGDWRTIRCPNCSSTLTSADVKRFAPKASYVRYTALANRARFAAIPSFRWCLSPTCSSGQIHHGGNKAPIFTCIECGHKSCVVHNRPWHEGETCKQFNQRTDGRKKIREEQASMRVVGQTTKICPGKGCGWRMQKISGCDHMTCSMCRHEFCWLCMADYKMIRSQGNNIHMASCPHHTNNVQ